VMGLVVAVERALEVEQRVGDGGGLGRCGHVSATGDLCHRPAAATGLGGAVAIKLGAEQ
jgi:hypothetical protein